MLLLPIGTDAPQKIRPMVNYVIIGLNIFYYLVLNVLAESGAPGTQELLHLRQRLVLLPAMPETYQFVTYQFLHGNLVHLLGNMWFLWIFGNAVNSKMGHIPYLFFYLAGGVFAGLGFAIVQPMGQVVGASGSIAAVTTAFLVLFPRTQVRMFYWVFFFIGTIEVGAIILILGKMVLWDNVIAMNLAGGALERGVAYEAHLAGYAFGLASALLMLWAGALPRDVFDILALVSRWRRRTQFASLYSVERVRQATVARPARPPDGPAEPRAATPRTPADDLRDQIARAIDDFQLPEAVRLYRQLLQMDPDCVLGRTNQLDVANQLTHEGDFELAAQAYERYLQLYPNGLTAQHVRFLLGVIYARHLRRYAKAAECLETCRRDLTDPNMTRQCDYWLGVVRGQTGQQGA